MVALCDQTLRSMYPDFAAGRLRQAGNYVVSRDFDDTAKRRAVLLRRLERITDFLVRLPGDAAVPAVPHLEEQSDIGGAGVDHAEAQHAEAGFVALGEIGKLELDQIARGRNLTDSFQRL